MSSSRPTLGRASESSEDTENSWYSRAVTNWMNCSPSALDEAENNILKYLKTPYNTRSIDIGDIVGKNDKIWTLSLNEESKQVPLLLLHGLGAGVALWVLNLDDLAATRPVYAIDLLGFGRSSRPTFGESAEEVEQQYVRSIEAWCVAVGLSKFVLCGHSFGGFLAAAYALAHPERIQFLILADPWGFPDKNADVRSGKEVSRSARILAFLPCNPLFLLRVAGPLGHWLLQKMRADILRKYETFLQSNTELMTQYIYQCNARSPTGEAAFYAMWDHLGFAKRPMILRIKDLPPEMPIIFIYGSKSWVDSAPGDIIKKEREVLVEHIDGAGHHIFADKPAVFNGIIARVCDKCQ